MTAKAIPAEDVKLKDGDVVVAGEVNGGLEGHGFQRRANGVSLVQGVAELLPRHNDPAKHTHCFKTHQLYIPTIYKLIHYQLTASSGMSLQCMPASREHPMMP